MSLVCTSHVTSLHFICYVYKDVYAFFNLRVLLIPTVACVVSTVTGVGWRIPILIYYQPMDRFSQLEAFVATATLGSFSAAARAEGVTPALIGRRLDALEARLGVRLFVRSTRRLSLTTEGHALLEEAPVILQGLHDTEARISQGGAKPVGLLRVSAPAGFGRRHVAPLLPALQSQYPGLEISLDLSDDFVDLASERYDCVIRIGELNDSSLVGVRLAENQRVVVGSPAYLQRQGSPQHPLDLVDHQCLSLSAKSGQAKGWLFRVDGHTITQRVGGRLVCSDGSVLRQWCLDGHGLAWRSLWEVNNDIEQGHLVTVLNAFQAPVNGIFVLMPNRRLTPVRVRVFVEWLKCWYQTQGFFG